jgi:hypothetical protein
VRSKGSKEFRRENFESFRQTNHTTPNIVTPNIVSEYSYSSIKPTELHTIAAQSSFRSLTRQHNTQSLAATKTVPYQREPLCCGLMALVRVETATASLRRRTQSAKAKFFLGRILISICNIR